MPEGDTLYRAAVNLRAALDGREIVSAVGKRRYLDARQLKGAIVTSVQSRGKHLIMHLGDTRVLHSHMGMTGSWHIYTKGESLRKPQSQIALSLATADSTHVVCFTPKTLELLTHAQFRRHRWLSRLGPDVLDEKFDISEMIRRFRFHDQTPIGEAVMNQSILCGIGNVYKSEVLFLCGVSPHLPVGCLSDDRLHEIVGVARDLMRRNLEGYPRRTRLGRDGTDKWVYGRAGEPCHKCGTPLAITRQGDLGRSTYFCGQCQAID